MDKAIFEDIKEKLGNQAIIKYQEIQAGSNNKLYCIETNKNSLLAKVYHQDDRQRLQREFQAICFFNKLRLAHTPRAFFKNDTLQYAIYSYEEGFTKNARELTPQDIENMAIFIATIHNIQPEQVKENFQSAIMACFSLEDYINNIKFRLGKFTDYISEKNAYPQIVHFSKKTNIPVLIETLVSDSIENIPQKEIAINLATEFRRLSPVDFGPHNMIFKENGDITFVDFEYFGWDDPARLIGDFMNHDQTSGVSDANKKLFINIYRNHVTLPQESLSRIEIVTKLITVEWLAIILFSLTPEKIRARQFADKDFNLDSYIEGQIKKFNGRLHHLMVYK